MIFIINILLLILSAMCLIFAVIIKKERFDWFKDSKPAPPLRGGFDPLEIGTRPSDSIVVFPETSENEGGIDPNENDIDRRLRLLVSSRLVKNADNNAKVLKLLDDFVGGSELFRSFSEWSVSETVFTDLLAALQVLATAYTNETHSMFRNGDLFSALKYSLETVHAKIDSYKPFKPYTFPWGKNWYQFSVSLPNYYVLIYYRLRNLERFQSTAWLREIIVSDVLSLVTDPEHSLGWKRTGPNTILMGCNWLVAMHLAGRLSEAVKDPSTAYMQEQANMDPVTSGEGIRPDGGFIFHTNLRAYGYIASSRNSALLASQIIPNRFAEVYTRLSDLMCHPTINQNQMGLFTRENKQKRFMDPGKLGVHVLHSVRVITAKFPNYFAQFLGTAKEIAFYESDKSNDAWMQYWVMSRELYVHNYTRLFTADTCIYQAGILHYGGQLVRMPTQTTTTTTFTTDQGISSVVQYEDELCAFFTRYSIPSFSKTTICELTSCEKHGKFSFYVFFGGDVPTISVETGELLENGEDIIKFTKKSVKLLLGERVADVVVKNDIRTDSGVVRKDVSEICVQLKPVKQNGMFVAAFYTSVDGYFPDIRLNFKDSRSISIFLDQYFISGGGHHIYDEGYDFLMVSKFKSFKLDDIPKEGVPVFISTRLFGYYDVDAVFSYDLYNAIPYGLRILPDHDKSKFYISTRVDFVETKDTNFVYPYRFYKNAIAEGENIGGVSGTQRWDLATNGSLSRNLLVLEDKKMAPGYIFGSKVFISNYTEINNYQQKLTKPSKEQLPKDYDLGGL